jgi:hypothetical protein
VRVVNSARETLLSIVVLLPLFLFRPNRCSPAWWIWLALGSALGVALAVGFLFLDGAKDLVQAFCSLGVGLAATWLLSPYLVSRSRPGVALKTLPVLAGFSVLAFLPTLLGQRADFFDFRTAFAVGLTTAGLVLTLALVLTGRTLRHRFGPVRLVLWAAVWLCLVWNIAVGPLVLLITAQGHVDWGEYFVGMLILSGMSLGLLLPLLLLSIFQPFYRGRLLAFLNLPPGPPAPQGPPPG